MHPAGPIDVVHLGGGRTRQADRAQRQKKEEQDGVHAERLERIARRAPDSPAHGGFHQSSSHRVGHHFSTSLFPAHNWSTRLRIRNAPTARAGAHLPFGDVGVFSVTQLTKLWVFYTD